MRLKTCVVMHLSVILSVLSAGALAAPASPFLTEFRQPDGTIVKGFVRGDETRNWIETEDGFTIANVDLPPNARGVEGWFYVSGFDANGEPIISRLKADRPPPDGLTPGLKPPANTLFDNRPRSVNRGALNRISRGGTNFPARAAPPGPFSGNVLFILAEFDDEAGSTLEADWANILTNDVVDYFSEASYGDVSLAPANESSGTANNGVVDWVNIGTTHPDPGGNFTTNGVDFHQIARDAILASDSTVDYSQYDADFDSKISSEELSIVIVVAGNETAIGGGTPSLWGHAWCISLVTPPTVDGMLVGACDEGLGYVEVGELQLGSQATLGIIAHELGHLTFGLPDLYDTDPSSGGIYHYGLMGTGTWGMAPSDTQIGQTPVLPSAWSRYTMGWVTGAEGNGVETIVAAGDTAATEANTVFRASTPVSTEYFLVENRQQVGYDEGLAIFQNTGFCGQAIWHIDDTKTTNSDDLDRWVDLEEADGSEGDFPSEPDLFVSGGSDTFNAGTTPSSNMKDGSPTGITIENISACTTGTAMTADFAILTCNGEIVTVNLEYGDVTTSNKDVVLGTSGNDLINGMGGDDVICALAGNDVINSGRGLDWVDAGDGDDEVVGGNDADMIFGGPGDDNLNGGPGDDFIYGEEDDDTIYGNSGSDVIDGGDGVDNIRGGSGNDDISTGSGATVGTSSLVDAGSGNDTITGGPDADVLRGSTDDDTINGGPGDDQLFGGGGIDIINGQSGNDLIRGNANVDTLMGGSGIDDVDGGSSGDIITGGADDDVLKGSTGNDVIHGESGNDEIVGGGGNDDLFGDSGTDNIKGGGSNDTMDGGGGAGDICDGETGTDTATATCEIVLNVP